MAICPVCGSSAATPGGRFTANASEAAQHFVLAEADGLRHAALAAHISSLWDAPQCEMMECQDCGLGFAHPFVAGDGEFYNLAYPHSDYPRDKWEFSLTAKALTQLITKDKRGLEIGSGFGYFLKQISPIFFRADHLVAIEYNDVAGQRLAEGGFTVLNRDVRSDAFAKPEYQFDFIFMFQVLEHMDELGPLTRRLREITASGAHLFIAVPNPARIAFNESTNSLQDMPPNHISLWTKKAFDHFGAQLDCAVVDYQVEPMAWLKLIKQDLVYSYMRSSQRSGSFANRLRSKPRSALRRVAEASFTLATMPSRMRYWFRALKSSETLGGSIWLHLQRR